MSNTNHNLRFAARFPVTAYVLLQIGFWVVANLFLAILIHLVFLLTKTVFNIPTPGALLPTLVLATILGILYGTTYGFVDYHFENEFFKRKPLGKIILLKTMVSLGMFLLLFALMRFALFDLIIVPAMIDKVSPLTDASWKILFNLFLVFYLLTGLIINFTNQVNRKFGPGVLLPLLLGKYRNPKEEERLYSRKRKFDLWFYAYNDGSLIKEDGLAIVEGTEIYNAMIVHKYNKQLIDIILAFKGLNERAGDK